MYLRRLFILGFFLSVFTLESGNASQNFSVKSKGEMISIWKKQIARNHGVHAWNSDNDALFVFQEWIALLSDAENKSDSEKRRIGLEFQKYVVDGNIRPTSKIGTSFPIPGYSSGDFDMSLLGCISLIGLFEKDPLLLTDKTLVHLIKNVVQVWGQKPKSHFDVFFFAFRESENHLFMSESTRFLTNQMIWENTRNLSALTVLRDSLVNEGIVLNNAQGSLKEVLLKEMHRTLCKGFFEFNALIYQRFTLNALNNLYSFAHDSSIQNGSGGLLDYLSVTFAFQSYGSLRYGPYRRSSEVFQESNLIRNDAACSFFSVQSGVYPWDKKSMQAFYEDHITHSSMALFSTVLKYRIPDPILDYMQNRPEQYQAEIYSAYSGNGDRKIATERYSGGKNYLLTAGGHYEKYAGLNFPTFKFGLKKSPWVYDVITRSSSLILNPTTENPKQLEDILHFRGPQWQSNNMALYANVLYGYAEKTRAKPFISDDNWPQVLPVKWTETQYGGNLYATTFATEKFDFRFIDRSKSGVYIVLSRLHPEKTFFHWSFQNFDRGTIEVIDTSRIRSIAALKDSVLALNSPSSERPNFFNKSNRGNRYIYVNFSGERIQLNPRYDGKNDGIIALEAGKGKSNDLVKNEAVAGFFNPSDFFKTFLPTKTSPLFIVKSEGQWKGQIALADGEGELKIFNSRTGGTVSVDFRNWWNPQRLVLDSGN